jgi:hypothetical protein
MEAKILEKAAIKIQAKYRNRNAKTEVRDLLSSVMDKLYDPVSGLHYYYNNATGASQWTKPKLLGDDDLHFSPRDPAKKSPRDNNSNDTTAAAQPATTKPKVALTDEGAARKVQTCWRVKTV